MSPRSEHPTDVGSGRQVPVSRRSILGAGTLSALGVGLMSLAPTAAVAAPHSALSIVSAPVGYSEMLAAWLAEYHVADQEAHQVCKDTWATVKAVCGNSDEVWRAFDRYDVAKNNLRDLSEAHTVEMIALHFPGIAGAIRQVYQHIVETGLVEAAHCCEGVELW
jgi:hypothetical protein